MKSLVVESPFRLAMLACASRQRNMGRFGAQIRGAVNAGVGTATIPDVSINVTSKTYHQLKKQGRLPC